MDLGGGKNRPRGKLFSLGREKSIDSQMGMIIIDRNRSRDWLVTQKP